MTREQIMREIAELDKEINRVLASAQLPSLKVKPFPWGTWFLTLLAFAWYVAGDLVPYANAYHAKYGYIGLYVGIIFGILAIISTLSWMFQRRRPLSKEYEAATEKSKVLQERRRELQKRLREEEEEA